MGLDMYLNRRKYVGNKWKDKDKQAKIEVEGVKQERVSEVVEEVGYWRKANAIHKWFVENVQDGEDDCHEYRVTTEQLQELLDLVNKVLAGSKLVKGQIANGYTFENGKKKPTMVEGRYIKDSKLAEELLPTTEGFFFGSQDYDEYYYQDLQDTKKILEEVLNDKGDGDYYYQSSW